ncbi:MAG: threonylcarbamoyl-AMP synthase, partial [Clostridiales bacterium]|nr:threonylcarbamoyl-AMP synthase [Clostridiales bacterium]
MLTMSEGDLARAASILKGGGLVAFPTETVYGLGANALDANAVSGIFKAKGRPCDNPLITHIADKSRLEALVEAVPAAAEKLIDAFWPGPLTIVMKKSRNVPDIVSAGLDTVGVRLPEHPVALRFLTACGLPVAAPSANTSGKPSPTAAAHVAEDLAGKIDAIVDGGKCGIGLESTVIDVSGEVPALLRPGGVTYEQLTSLLGEVL